MGLIRMLPDGRAEYEERGYSAIVAPDGAIVVQPGDSLSKYSMAIYGDFANMDRKFGRKNAMGAVKSFAESGANINYIQVGEIIYHMSRYKTHGRDEASPDIVPPGAPGAPAIPPSAFERQLSEAIQYMRKVYWPITDWAVTGSHGASLGLNTPAIKLGGSVSGMRFWVKRNRDPKATQMTGLSVGGSVGLDPDPWVIGGSLSTSDFPSAGFILKSPNAGGTLSKAELSGAFVSLEFNGNLIGGGSLIIILGGPSVTEFLMNPLKAVTRTIMAKWMLVSLGTNVGAPDFSVTLSSGYCYAA